ncbi:transcriptional regulator, LacI family [Quadrisphaera granulorum]|uniref:LacI family transcriptional regulator n=1 Tax=Quadrisphaera granulorum TaxID=317664 RepID=A0A316A6R0_9ACTN|nr:LacI family DNA-binding transcriptional regulator [Quadrisphaera granulorum]PWJ53273.1 LacI family transcriptional regulator [Quadrisphaera granulorum]SZE96947.1 transcriptional regulator, LacI family [Quadrisphaera granulorum]
MTGPSRQATEAEPGPGRVPVMADVAARAGVSLQTVSRVVNGHPSVRDETRRRVEQAIAELDYRVNTAARALVTRSTRTIGLISASTAEFGPTSALLGVEHAARAAGYSTSVVLLPTVGRREVRDAVDHLRDLGVDGLVVIAPDDAAVAAVEALDAAVPVVTLEAPLADPRPGGDAAGLPSASVDQEEGARRAVRHLLDLGHATVHHVSGPSDWLEARAREAGWRAELLAAGVSAPPVVPGDWGAAAGYRAAAVLVERGATAVFTGNDQLAIGLMGALWQRGLRIPDDVSVVGFDDVPEAAYLVPPLTTVRQDFDALGRRCLEVLLARLRGEPARVGRVEPELVLRASTAPPRRTRQG